ncbi:MAG TPA: histidinol dehydrogenase, partial [Gemmatales bacterium]|nr:histidinol dehydrogenase [Gemmatales bacterium]
LMTAVPAQAAGVHELVVVAPPTPFGSLNTDLLAVCHELGIAEVYRVGGAQAIAALAHGLETLPRVDMIVGPGNLFVALAKRQLYGQVGIDLVAGPSEVIVLADESAHPEFIAADLIAQAEHSPGASVLVTWHAPLVDAVAAELERQLAGLSRGDLARAALEQFGALVLAADADAALELVNELAPEHLHIQTREAARHVERLDRAGAVFIGPYSPVAVGDYLAGPSHVLPTGGTARFASGLTANDFLRRQSVIQFDQAALRQHAADVTTLAELEALPGHAQSVRVRLPNLD